MNPAADLFKKNTTGFYTHICGYTHALYEQHTFCSSLVQRKILKIIDNCRIPYFLFAGSMVGYIRNKRMPPWMDDLDIMILEENVENFWNIAAPELIECGFTCRKVDQPFSEGGAHILGLQMGNDRHQKLPLATGIEKSVPWTQVDVFFSKIDKDGFVKNLAGWGLYHRKDVRSSWVLPGTTVEIEGQTFPVFSDYESDIFHEYGDVLNNIVVQTHDQVFLRKSHMNWKDFENHRLHYLNSTLRPLPIEVPIESYQRYHGHPDRSFSSEESMSFAEILAGILASSATRVLLTNEVQLLFCPDIKRLFPDIHLEVSISSMRFVRHAAHLAYSFDVAQFATQDLKEQHAKIFEALTRNHALRENP